MWPYIDYIANNKEKKYIQVQPIQMQNKSNQTQKKTLQVCTFNNRNAHMGKKSAKSNNHITIP